MCTIFCLEPLLFSVGWGSNFTIPIDSDGHPYNTLTLPCERVILFNCKSPSTFMHNQLPLFQDARKVGISKWALVRFWTQWRKHPSV